MTAGTRELIVDSPVLATMAPRPAYRVDVQGLRGLSVLLVVLFHAGLSTSGGFIGVDVFFVISGFVIGRGLMSEAERYGTISLSKFYARRVRRLLPALAAMLIVVSLACVLILPPAFPQPNALLTARAAALSFSNIFLWVRGSEYFAPAEVNNPFLHTWSLGVEEQFYLLFPLLVFLSWRLGSRARRLSTPRALFTWIAVGIALVSAVCAIAWTSGIGGLADVVPHAERFAFYGPISRMWEFLAGVLVARWTMSRDPRPRTRSSVARSAGAAGLAMIGLSAFAFSETTPFPGIAAVLPVVGAVLVIGSGVGAAARLLNLPALVWLGDRSYSWYLWHWPAIVLGTFLLPSVPAVKPLAALISLVPAMLSYRYLERRFRAGAERTRHTAPRLAVVSVGVSMALITVSLFGAARSWGVKQHPELAAESISQEKGCYQASTPLADCTFGARSRGTLMLVGDSHADTMSDAVVKAATDEGYQVVIQTYLKCPFLTVALTFEPECVARQAHTFEMIRKIGPELVVIANNAPGALANLGGTSRDGTMHHDALISWEAALRTTFTDIEPFVDRVVLVSVVPTFSADVFDRALPTLLRPGGGYPTVSVESIQRRREPLLAAEARAAAAADDLVESLDPLEHLCPHGSCALRASDGLFRYRDGGHLSNPVARELDDLIRASLRANPV
jgi:peptidoglycan/LPS O-acetylase OafA/YrhL